MKAMQQILTCLFLVTAIVYALARPNDSTLNLFPKNLASAEKYTDKYDNINVDEILNSNRLLTSYFKCLMGEGRCTPDGNEMRKILPEALATECLKCTEKQKEIIHKVVYFLIMNKPKLWKQLTEKYDPENKYKSKYEEEVKKLTEGVH